MENVPVEVIRKFNTVGDIKPLKLRIETAEHTLITTLIEERKSVV